jgi:hypothetical protein
MAPRQFAFLVGFLCLWAVWAVGFWQAALAVLIGIVAYVAVRAVERDLDFGDLTDRMMAGLRR